MNEIKKERREKALAQARELAEVLNEGDLAAAYRVIWDERRELPVIVHRGSINSLQLSRNAVQTWLSRNTTGWWFESFNNEPAITFI